MIRTPALSFFVLAAALVACGGPEPKSQQSLHENGVPANSLSEKRLGADEKKPEPTATPTESKPDPTQPYMQPMGGSGGGDDSAPAGAGAAAPPGGKSGKGTISKSECGQLFDRYLELAIGNDARLEGIPPELLQQAKAQARQQKGDPCDKEAVKRSKYNCAMAAKTTQQWEKCMK